MDVIAAQKTIAPIAMKPFITASEIPTLLDQWGEGISVLSLDCFDTLLWRQTATPKDVFHALQERPLFQSLGVTAYQRQASAARAYRAKAITNRTRQVNLQDIYHSFSTLTDQDKHALAEEEIRTEMDLCYAFWPFVELIRQAQQRGIRVVIVSDMYLTAQQLRRLLEMHLPTDVLQAIEQIYTSYDFGLSKSDGLFQPVCERLNVSVHSVLHIGDHPFADYEAPKKLGLNAIQFKQFDELTQTVLRWQTIAASLTGLAKPVPVKLRETRYQPFRPIYSLQQQAHATPEYLIGYMTFGPILYAFAHFVDDEIKALQQAGKKVKVFFLLRDAYLLYRACEAYAGKPLGELARIRKFLAVAASFRTQEDIDYYLSGIKPEYFNTWVIGEQLLLSPDEIMRIQGIVQQTQQPQETFYAILHSPEIMQQVFQKSAALRQRLKRYLQEVLKVEAGDTLVLVDTGYHGVTQDFLNRALQTEMNIEIQGRYFIGSHEPDRPECRSMLTSTWCEHGLFEQSCTYKEGAVTDYDEKGQPVFEPIKLADRQYEKVRSLQHEAVRFIRDTKQYFTHAGSSPSYPILKQNAEATLLRHIFFPLPLEIAYFNDFQHDKDMGSDRSKTMFDVNAKRQQLPRLMAGHKHHPYEERAINVDHSLSSLMKRAFDLEFPQDEKSFCYEAIKIVMVKGSEFDEVMAYAVPTHDGYYSFSINSQSNCHIGIVWGEVYQWVQVDSICLSNQPTINLLNDEQRIILNKMNRQQNLFECMTSDAYLMLPALNQMAMNISYQIVFRPLIRKGM